MLGRSSYRCRPLLGKTRSFRQRQTKRYCGNLMGSRRRRPCLDRHRRRYPRYPESSRQLPGRRFDTMGVRNTNSSRNLHLTTLIQTMKSPSQ